MFVRYRTSLPTSRYTHCEFRAYWRMVVCTARHWVADQPSMVAVSLAFYCAFSLVPLLVIISFLLSLALGEATANSYLTTQLNSCHAAAKRSSPTS